MKAIILAAGYGTRLHPLTLDKPKAFVEVNNKTILEHTVDKIDKVPQIDKIIIVTNNKFHSNFLNWKNSKQHQKEIVIINDGTNSNEDRLGALGDLILSIKTENVDEDILLLASDNIFDFDLNTMINSEKKESDLIGVYEFDINEIKKYGVVVLGEDNKLIELQEKPENPKSNLASIGIYLFRKDTLELLDKYVGEGNKLEGPGFFLEWLPKHKDVYCHKFEGKWFDIGSLEILEMAKKEFLN